MVVSGKMADKSNFRLIGVRLIEIHLYMKSRGIQRELRALHTPEQVGGAERPDRAQVGLTRAMLMDASLPQLVWAYAIACTCILVNRIVSVGNRYHHMRCSVEL